MYAKYIKRILDFSLALLALIPIWLYPFIPEDLELTSIGGNKDFAPNIDTDVRFGCLAWGILLKEDSV